MEKKISNRPWQVRIIDSLGVTPDIDPYQEIFKRVNFLKTYLEKTGLNGFVLGVSGGVDSTNAGRLAQMAVDLLNQENPDKNYKFIAMRLPYGVQADEADAQMALKFIKPTEVITYDIKPQVDAAMAQWTQRDEIISDFVKGNNKARARMLAQYDFAAEEGLLVIGTDHAAEAVTGFFTKYGDGACDVAPLAGLSKRQGREIAKTLGAPKHLYEKAATADLLDNVPQQTDETELGITYEMLDDFLEGYEVPDDVAEKIIQRFILTHHKRELPVTPEDDWWM